MKYFLFGVILSALTIIYIVGGCIMLLDLLEHIDTFLECVLYVCFVVIYTLLPIELYLTLKDYK